jgi:hypothetical protein
MVRSKKSIFGSINFEFWINFGSVFSSINRLEQNVYAFKIEIKFCKTLITRGFYNNDFLENID